MEEGFLKVKYKNNNQFKSDKKCQSNVVKCDKVKIYMYLYIAFTECSITLDVLYISR